LSCSSVVTKEITILEDFKVLRKRELKMRTMRLRYEQKMDIMKIKYEKVEEAKEQNDVIEILSSDAEEGSIGIVDNEQKSSRARNS
jgi:hypothetical protein